MRCRIERRNPIGGARRHVATSLGGDALGELQPGQAASRGHLGRRANRASPRRRHAPPRRRGCGRPSSPSPDGARRRSWSGRATARRPRAEPRPRSRRRARSWPRREAGPARRAGSRGPVRSAASARPTASRRARRPRCHTRAAARSGNRGQRRHEPPSSISASVASGRPKRIFSRALVAKITGSCGTSASARRKSLRAIRRKSTPSSATVPPAGRRTAGSTAGSSSCPPQMARRAPPSLPVRSRNRRHQGHADPLASDTKTARREN